MKKLTKSEISWSRTNQTAQTHQGEGDGGGWGHSAPQYFELGLEYPLQYPLQPQILQFWRKRTEIVHLWFL